jgi:hypothetical protein
MAAWTNLTDAVLSIAKPFTYVIARAMRDNAIAIAEGAVGAPRVVVPTALSTAETNTAKVLRPNGSGGVEWISGGNIAYKSSRVTTFPNSSGSLALTAFTSGVWKFDFGMTYYDGTDYWVSVVTGLLDVTNDRIETALITSGITTTQDTKFSCFEQNVFDVLNIGGGYTYTMTYNTSTNVLSVSTLNPAATGYPAFLSAFQIS